jgi:methyl-accepting chemotaxis protein
MKKFKNAGIRVKVLAIVAINIVFYVSIAVIVMRNMRNQTEAEKSIIQNGKVLFYFQDGDMMHDAIRGDIFKLMYAVSTDSSLIQDVRSDFEEHSSTFLSEIDSVDKFNKNEEIRKQIQSVNPALRAYINFGRNLMDLSLKGDTTSKRVLYSKIGEFQEAFNNLAVQQEKLAELVLNSSSQVQNNIEEQSKYSAMALATMIISAIVLSILLGLIIISIIVTPLKKAVTLAEKIADGDLSVILDDITQEDEVGVLFKAIKRMNVKLKEVINSVVMASESIANASGQMNYTAQKMSKGATEQASSVEEISTSMEQMVANIQQNTTNSKQTETIARKAAIDIKEGNDSVSQTVSSMKTIASKISIIGEISRQTNLLALNAAVEAARAGEHGKGFAVVAAEVRKLAERSRVAAVEIDDVSSYSVGIAQKSGDLLNNVVPGIQKTSDLIAEITTASSEQNVGANQVNSAIQQLNMIVQETAAAAEEMAQGSEELSSQADQLKDIILFFKTDEGAIKSTIHRNINVVSRQEKGTKLSLDKKIGNDHDDDVKKFEAKPQRILSLEDEDFESF